MEFRLAKTEIEIDDALAAFSRHKTHWFEARGIVNPFEASAMNFLGTLARDPASGFELHVLTVALQVVAVAGILCGRTRALLMVVSYDADGPSASCSPGILLIQVAMAELQRRGFGAFDLGLGHSDYKVRLGAKSQPTAVLIKPMNLLGHLGATSFRTIHVAKVVIKRNPPLVRILQKIGAKLRSTFRDEYHQRDGRPGSSGISADDFAKREHAKAGRR